VIFSGGISGVEAETPLLSTHYRVCPAVSIPERRFFQKVIEQGRPWKWCKRDNRLKTPA